MILPIVVPNISAHLKEINKLQTTWKKTIITEVLSRPLFTDSFHLKLNYLISVPSEPAMRWQCFTAAFAISTSLSTRKLPSVSINTASPAKPSRNSGICTSKHNSKLKFHWLINVSVSCGITIVANSSIPFLYRSPDLSFSYSGRTAKFCDLCEWHSSSK